MSLSRCFLLIVLLTALPAARGATFSIANGDVAGLKAAINAANGNKVADTINLASNGTYTLTSIDNLSGGPTGLPVVGNDFAGTGADLTINGNGATLQRSTAANTPNFRLLEVTSGAGCVVNNLAMVNGSLKLTDADQPGGAALYNSGSQVSLFTCNLHDNRVVGYTNGGQAGIAGGPARGGAIYSAGINLILNGCTFAYDSVLGGTGDNGLRDDGEYVHPPQPGGEGQGGAVYTTNALLSLNCTFNNNTATGGTGGVSIDGASGGFGRGGALYSAGGETAFLSGTNFYDNQAVGGTGGAGNGTHATNYDHGYGGGGGSSRGGAIYRLGALAMSNGVVRRSAAASGTPGHGSYFDGDWSYNGGGGGIYQGYGGGLSLTDVGITENTAYCYFNGGGGIYIQDAGDGTQAQTPPTPSAITFLRCILNGNRTLASGAGSGYQSGHGGTLLDENSSSVQTVTITNCAIYNNASGYFGGLYFTTERYGSNTNLTATNVTFSANGGGALFDRNSSSTSDETIIDSLAFLNCTFADNNGASSAGASCILTEQSNVTLGNTIFKAGAPGVNLIHQGRGSFISRGGNLSSDAANGDGATGPGGFLNAPGDQRNTDPKLLALTDNGGKTNTHALSNSKFSRSPAIDAGNGATAPHRDQRGYFRSGTADSGACESAGGLIGDTSISQSGTDAAVTVEVVSGMTYRLERKLNLIDAWQAVAAIPDFVASADASGVFADAHALSLGHAFYRVRLVQ